VQIEQLDPGRVRVTCPHCPWSYEGPDRAECEEYVARHVRRDHPHREPPPAPELGPNEYRCADCGGIFQRVPDHQAAALAEAEQLWGVPNADTAPGMAEVCEDCFQDVRRRYPRGYPPPVPVEPMAVLRATLAARPNLAELRAIVGPEIVADMEAIGMDPDIALQAAADVATGQILEAFLRGAGIGRPIGITAYASVEDIAAPDGTREVVGLRDAAFTLEGTWQPSPGFTPADIARLFDVPEWAIHGPTRAKRRREGKRLVREEIARRRLAKLTA